MYYAKVIKFPPEYLNLKTERRTYCDCRIYLSARPLSSSAWVICDSGLLANHRAAHFETIHPKNYSHRFRLLYPRVGWSLKFYFFYGLNTKYGPEEKIRSKGRSSWGNIYNIWYINLKMVKNSFLKFSKVIDRIFLECEFNIS